VLAAAEAALDPQRSALGIDRDHGVIANRLARAAEVLDRLPGPMAARIFG